MFSFAFLTRKIICDQLLNARNTPREDDGKVIKI